LQAEIEAVDELVVTELIFEGVFNRLDVPSTAATVACMLDCERASKSPSLSPALNECLTTVQVLCVAQFLFCIIKLLC
jgi:ATP-dependent RNA helicase DOB1